MLTPGSAVKFINNHGQVDDLICEVVEELSDFVRLKKPSGEIFRIYKDRIINIEDKIYPWNDLPDDIVIYYKANLFNESTSCKSISILHKSWNHFFACNTYNGTIAGKLIEYPTKNFNKTIDKLIKKGYSEISREKLNQII